MRMDPAYARALLGAAPLADLARAVARRAVRRPPVPALPIDGEARRLAADALARAPSLSAGEPVGVPWAELFPDGRARVVEHAREILRTRVHIFERRFEFGGPIDWLRHPQTGAPLDRDGDPRVVLA